MLSALIPVTFQWSKAKYCGAVTVSETLSSAKCFSVHAPSPPTVTVYFVDSLEYHDSVTSFDGIVNVTIFGAFESGVVNVNPSGAVQPLNVLPVPIFVISAVAVTVSPGFAVAAA